MTTRAFIELGLRYPIIQAPMAGGATTPELVAAVCNAGGLGSFAVGSLSPDAILAGVTRIRELTSRPFNVNLFVIDEAQPDPAQLQRALALLAPIAKDLGLSPLSLPERYSKDGRAQIEAVLQAAPSVVSFTFGIPDAEVIKQFKKSGALVVGSATTVAEARAWEAAGADLICVQGSEAGGHRCSFLKPFEESSIGLFALLPQVVRAISVPVIAAGGIMNGRGIAAAFTLGARYVQMGTAFLCCAESGISPVWKSALLHAQEDQTRVTKAFSGRPARGLVNAFMDQLRPHEDTLPRYPIFNAMTAGIRAAATRQGRSEYMSLWAGQGVGMVRSLGAAELIAILAAELDEAKCEAVTR